MTSKVRLQIIAHLHERNVRKLPESTASKPSMIIERNKRDRFCNMIPNFLLTAEDIAQNIVANEENHTYDNHLCNYKNHYDLGSHFSFLWIPTSQLIWSLSATKCLMHSFQNNCIPFINKFRSKETHLRANFVVAPNAYGM